jgi:hypothetical protein
MDENGCRASRNLFIDEVIIAFEPLSDQCIQACREDLDSLQLTIPGIDGSFSDWTWVTVDSLGNEYEVDTQSGAITPLTITAAMYDYVQLQITQDECTFRSEKIPLDIEPCFQPEPPVEIICTSINSNHISCGQSVYKCLLSEENGGPKLYFEGSVTLPMGAVLCEEDALTVSLNNGQIIITDLLVKEVEGKLMVFYSANLLITDTDDYQENGTVIKFDFCNEEEEIAYCYEYSLPYRTCTIDFTCLIDYQGISSGNNQSVDINYCLNLSEVIQDDCTLSEYTVRAVLSSDINAKEVYTQKLEGNFDHLHCISINVSQEDFFGGAYQCIELLVEGDCPDIACSEFQCGIFGNSYLMSINSDNITLHGAQVAKMDKVEENSKSIPESLLIYPNPSTGVVTFELDGHSTNPADLFDKNEYQVLVKNAVGQTVRMFNFGRFQKQTKDLSDMVSGLYFASLIHEGETLSVHKILLIN